MAFNGSGVWSYTYSWTNDAANGIPITASRMDSQFNDVGNNGFDNCITRDGQGFATANIPFGGFKITGLGPGSAATDAVNLNQITAPTRQVLTSGSAATYTTPTSPQAPRQLQIRMVAGGGGGAAGNGGGAATAGGATSFNSIVATGGGAGADSSLAGQGGNSGSGSASFRAGGQSGASGGAVLTASGIAFNGAVGGASVLGGGSSLAGTNAKANTGAGGYGGNGSGYAGTTGGGGGGGEYVEIIINSPAATYTYTVGAGGTGGTLGTGTSAGANGGSGVIIVDEFY